MENILDWFEALLLALLGLKAVATLIVNSTHTPHDDEWLGRFYGWIEVVAGIYSRKAKELPGEFTRRPSDL
jgi:hypothetical protein